MEQEQTAIQKDIVTEIENYGHHQEILAVDRDGDLFYIECPNCHSTDLNTKSLIACRKCHTFFNIYFEDGFHKYTVFTDFGEINGYDNKIKLIQLKPKDYFKFKLHGKNENKLSKLKEKYPDMKVITLYRDLGDDGMDAHRHEKYRKYAIIPLD